MRFFSQGSYNQAVDRFKKLRMLDDSTEEYKLEIIEAIQLCLAELKDKPEHGDAYILLADLLALAALQVQFRSDELYRYCVALSGMAIEAWRMTHEDGKRMRTKNPKAGFEIQPKIQAMVKETRFWELARAAGGRGNFFSSWLEHMLEESNINVLRNSLLQPEKFGTPRLIFPKTLFLATGFSKAELLKAALLWKYRHEVPQYVPDTEDLRAFKVMQALEELYEMTADDFLKVFQPSD